MRHTNGQLFIDVVIPAHKKDLDTLKHCIEGVKKNIASIRRIIVISKEKYTDKAEWFDEALFPFSYQEIEKLVTGGVGWNFQQLLKLYSPLVIPDISENVLIVDSDTVFLRPVKFFSDEGLPLYNLSKDTDLENSAFHQESIKHITKILPEIIEKLPENMRDISGICHHMLLQKHLIKELFTRVENQDGTGDSFYKIFLKNTDKMYGVSEYNLYFYFLVSLHSKEYQIRILHYKNTADFKLWKYRWRLKYHYCSFHSYMRENKKNFLQKIKESFFRKIDRYFFVEHWNIGIIDSPISKILDTKPAIKWLKDNDKMGFIADPFGFELNSQKYVVFEDYSQLKKIGRIGIAKLLPDSTLGERKIILDNKKHLSYPFIISNENRIFMICEAYKSEKLSLYEIDKENFEAKKIKDIFSGKKIVDPTVIFYQNKFWLFFTEGDCSNSKLYLAYSDSLFDEFKRHQNNPIKDDSFSARSAGTPFIVDGKIYRPSQNCSKEYGGSIVINQIVELDEKNFKEEFVCEVKPDAKSFYPDGLHTLSSLGNLTLIDGKRKLFIFYKPLISLLRNLLRILK